MAQLTDFVAYADAFGLGWMMVDYLASIVLFKGATFTRVRFFGWRFLKRDYAITLSFVQLAFAMVISYFMVDWIYAVVSAFSLYLISITICTIGFFYLYILAQNPYKVLTLRRIVPAVVLFILAVLTYYLVTLAA